MKRKRVGVALILLGLVGAVVCVVLGEISQRRLLDSFGRANVGCRTVFQFERTGTYYVYVETGQSRQIDSVCPVSTSGDLLEVRLLRDSAEVSLVEDANIEYEYRGATARSIRRFVVESSGLYELTATGPTASEIVAIGTDPTSGRRPWMMAAGLSAGIGVVGGVVLLLWRRRSKSDDADQATGTPAVGGDAPYLPAEAVAEAKRRQRAAERSAMPTPHAETSEQPRVQARTASARKVAGTDEPDQGGLAALARTPSTRPPETAKTSTPTSGTASPTKRGKSRQRPVVSAGASPLPIDDRDHVDRGNAPRRQRPPGGRRTGQTAANATPGEGRDPAIASSGQAAARTSRPAAGSPPRRPRRAPETIEDAVDLDEMLPPVRQQRRPQRRSSGEARRGLPGSRDTDRTESGDIGRGTGSNRPVVDGERPLGPRPAPSRGARPARSAASGPRRIQQSTDARSLDDRYDDERYTDDRYDDGSHLRAGYIDDSYVDDGYVDDGYVDDGYVDDGYVDDGYVDDGYVDDGYVEDGYVDDGYLDDGYVDRRGADDRDLYDDHSEDRYLDDDYGDDRYLDGVGSSAAHRTGPRRNGERSGRGRLPGREVGRRYLDYGDERYTDDRFERDVYAGDDGRANTSDTGRRETGRGPIPEMRSERLVNNPRPRALRSNRRFETELPGQVRGSRRDAYLGDDRSAVNDEEYFDDRTMDDRTMDDRFESATFVSRGSVTGDAAEFEPDWDVPASVGRGRRGGSSDSEALSSYVPAPPELGAFPPPPPPPETVAGYRLVDHGQDYSGEIYPQDWDRPAGGDTPPAPLRPVPQTASTTAAVDPSQSAPVDAREVQDEWHARGDDTGAFRWWSPPDGDR